MGDTTQWKKGRLLGSGGGGKVWYGMTQEKIEVEDLFSRSLVKIILDEPFELFDVIRYLNFVMS